MDGRSAGCVRVELHARFLDSFALHIKELHVSNLHHVETPVSCDTMLLNYYQPLLSFHYKNRWCVQGAHG